MEVSDTTPLGSAAVGKTDLNDGAESDKHASAGDISPKRRGVKRPAEDDLSDNASEDDEESRDQPIDASGEEIPMTKSQLKKLKRRKKWEESKEGRRLKRRDKRHERQARKRVQKEEEMAAAAAEGREPVLNDRRRNKSRPGAVAPIAIIIDCQFEKYMLEPELVSLASQVTRCYSDNRGAVHSAHLYISSYGGVLKERNETVLENQHLKWKGVRFCEGDFVEAAKEAKECMAGPKGGEMIDMLRQSASSECVSLVSSALATTKKAKTAPTPEPEAEDVDKSVVYLTADSPYTLNRLEPNTCYVVGGIIDKNREKGLCYRIAREKNVRTAKLPIGEYMVLQHRHILATNHVVEIMLKWLETGDWGTAFMKVIPTRKGGKLKAGEETPAEPAEKDAAEESENASAQVDDQ